VHALRSLIVCFTAYLALAAGKSFDNFVALIGGLCAVPLALLYPPLLHIRVCANENSRWEVFLDLLLASVGTSISFAQVSQQAKLVRVVGATCMVLATYQSLSTWNSAQG
jgi:amino acid permease